MKKNNDPEGGSKFSWRLVIEIIIAVLTAILGVIGGAKLEAATNFFSGIF